MSNLVRITVENPEELLAVGMYDAGAVLRVHSSADNIAFASIGTIALVAGTRTYTIADTTGTSTTWYRSRYENAGGTNVSEWSDSWQAGGEEGGLVCSLYDVKQRLGIAASDTDSDEDIMDLIRAVTVDIETFTGRDFTGSRSDTTFRVDTRYGDTLWLPKGIQSVTTLKVASTSQPDTGGTYETLASTAYVLRPAAASRDPGWPATAIRRIDGGVFWDAANGAEITGRAGWAEPPANIARIGASAVVSQYLTKGSDGPRALVGPDGRMTVLRDISPADWATLVSYAEARVA